MKAHSKSRKAHAAVSNIQRLAKEKLAADNGVKLSAALGGSACGLGGGAKPGGIGS
jgi:ribosomal protein L31E